MEDTNLFHRRVASECFNACWDLIEKPNRTEIDNEEMRRLSEVSYWHWKQYSDFTPENDSVGLWQLSRVYALTGHLRQALAYSIRSIEAAENGGLAPFFLGYAFEARARCQAHLGDFGAARDNLQIAREHAEAVEDKEDAEVLLADLVSIEKMIDGES